MSEHTSPWTLDLVGNGLQWPNPSARRDVYVCGPGGLVAVVPPCSNPRRALGAGSEIPDTDDCQEAMNLRDARARLISAAPDLLAALKALSGHAKLTRPSSLMVPLIEDADEAIAKAEGREPDSQSAS